MTKIYTPAEIVAALEAKPYDAKVQYFGQGVYQVAQRHVVDYCHATLVIDETGMITTWVVTAYCVQGRASTPEELTVINGGFEDASLFSYESAVGFDAVFG